MSDLEQERLLQMLSPEAATAVRRAMQSADDAKALWKEAFEAVEFPTGDLYPLPAELTSAQRAVAEVSARRGAEVGRFALPRNAARRRRWLGIDPGGELETLVRFEHEGQERHEPLWHAMQSTVRTDVNVWEQILSKPAAILGSLPIPRRLTAIGELFSERAQGRWPYEIEGEYLVLHPEVRLVADLGDEGGSWAVAMADDLLNQASKIAEGNPNIDQAWSCYHSFGAIRWAVFLALARAGVPVEPRWDPLLVVRSPRAYPELSHECVQAIDEGRRGAAIHAAMSHMYPTEVVEIGLQLIEVFPHRELLDSILQSAPQSRLSERLVLARLERILGGQSDLLDLLHAAKTRLPPIPDLVCTSVWTVTRLDALTSTEQDQLAIACKRWDGNDLPLRARFEGDDEELRVVGELEVCEIHDAEEGGGYTAYLLGHDSGTVFRRGTTEIVAEVVHLDLSSPDQALKDALELALSDKPSATAR